MKKLMSLLLIACFSVFVLGCGEGDKKATDKDKGTKAKPAETTKPADKDK